MTEAWQQEGRINQKRRTRAAILAAAAELVGQGRRPTVAEVADAALVSRATAYRYFPTQEYLLFEAALESTRSDIDQELEENTLPEDPEARLEMLIDALQKRIIDKEAAFRTMLRLSLEQSPEEEEEEHYDGESRPSRLRGGGRVRWIEKALAPVEGRLEEPHFRRLVAALSLCMGIEALIVLRDVCALEPEEAEEVSRWAARTLLRCSLAEVHASPR